MNIYKTHTLSNGLKLITVPMQAVDSVTVMVMIGAGSRYETRNINGLSHFLEHMAFKGSKKRPSALAISTEIDSIGGEFNAFTGKDHTGFYIKGRREHLPLLIDVLSDMILHPLLKKEEIEREKGVIIEEIHMYEDTPMRHISDVYESLLYGDTPLGWDTTGKPEIIRQITRGNFLQYIDNLYRPGNSIVTVAGNIKSEKNLTDLVKKSLSAWKNKPVWQFEYMTDKQNKPQVKLVYKNTEQAHIAIGVRAYPLNHPKKYSLSLLNVILGSGMSSRLFIEVRERRGLVYYVHSDLSQYKDVGNLVVQAGVDVNRIDEAITLIQSLLQGIALQKAAISPKELAKAKAYLKGRTTLEFEDSRSVAAFYATQEILKREIVTPKEFFRKIERVTINEVNEVAREIFQLNKLNLAIIGPFKEEEKFHKLLK